VQQNREPLCSSDLGRITQTYPKHLSSDELICLPFLDTGTLEEHRAADDELRARGYPTWLVRLLRRIAKIGLWYQVVAWEWGSLGVYDVLMGYGVIFLIISPFLVVFGFLWVGVMFGAGVLCLAIAVVGFWLRRRHDGAA